MKAKGNVSCRDCKRVDEKEERLMLSKSEADKMHEILDQTGEEFLCKCCEKSGTAKDFYYKLDRGYFYVNTTQCKRCTRDRMRFRAFGITREDFYEMLSKQDGNCAICEISMDEYVKTSQNNKVFSVDHCHTTGVIRGLLCCSCNRGIGYFKDNPNALNKAAKYLQIKR